MKTSCGLALIKDKKILLVHPTNSVGKSFSIPKGMIDKDEDYITCAIRETKEEVGIQINESDIIQEEKVIHYINKSERVYKKVYYFIVDVNHYDLPRQLPMQQLQYEEVDDARFYTYDEAIKITFWRYKKMLKELKKKKIIN